MAYLIDPRGPRTALEIQQAFKARPGSGSDSTKGSSSQAIRDGPEIVSVPFRTNHANV